MTTTGNTIIDESGSWITAGDYISHLGRFPPVFSLAVRALAHDHYKGLVGASPATQFLVLRLLRSPTMKSLLYYSALTFHGDTLSNVPYLSSADLIRLYRPGDLAGLIGAAFIFRTLRRAASTNADDPCWLALAKYCSERIEIGGHLGLAVPDLGASRGVIAAAFPPLAHALMLLGSPVGARPYISSIYMDKAAPDMSKEQSMWGCTSSDLASNMMHRLGFGVPLMLGFTHAYLLRDGVQGGEQEEATKFRYAFSWIDSLHSTGAAPSQKMPAIFYPTKKEMFRLMYAVTRIREDGTTYAWLERGKGDIGPQSTPQLYQEFLAEGAPPEEIQRFCAENFDKEMIQDMGEEELKQITNPDSSPFDF